MAADKHHKTIKSVLSSTEKELFSFIKEVQAIAVETKNTTLQQLVIDRQKTLSERLQVLNSNINQNLAGAIASKTEQLNDQIERLKKDNETARSNSFLLEYKKKDLLLLADNLEEAYEEISQKNEELEEQKKQLSQQAEEIKEANKAIIDQNEELEQQKEAILDQTDYLHEANETITAMHAEVQKQKEEILRKNEELISINNEKNNLIGIVAHDLKSPLNQIKGLITLIKMSADNLNSEAYSYIETIEKSATRLNEMIGKILDVEAIESKTPNINLTKVDLSELLRKTVERFDVLAKEKQINLHSDIPEGLTSKVDADYTYQVFENLLSNAIKFSPKFLNIYVSLKHENGQIICEVKDEGQGLSPEDKKKLFGKYQKLSARPTGNETSTGLGLSIVKKYVEAMNGQIWCESEVRKGASFFVSFPAVD
ncbi:hypothetical protein E1176_19955 [Fulvivirga sp. RKSG066]|uniref:ATP-binding protein n=1 Tax=Fulvivirga aurantia TaxID=2529383 RepID=UPI0012BC2640|nr:HAMP domain-containing sensor histidine kinase [Fulvivirga aurantia]MTI23314.1 hypothetical protein [Fulvivirga aurantia]